MDLIDINDELREVAEVEMVIPRNPKVYLVRRNPFEIYIDMQFKRKYRLSKGVAQFVINLIGNEILHVNNNRGLPVSPEVQVLTTIRYLAKGAYGDDIAEHHGLSQPTLSIIVKRVVEAIAGHREEFIKFPENEELNTVKTEFYNIARCSAIVGAIDGTHVKIKCPGGENPDLFINRKGYYSLNVQVVSDAKGKIRYIVARWRGSAHDSRIWNECLLRHRFAKLMVYYLEIMGTYPCSRYLLTPLLHPKTDSENRYNRAHISTRNVVERLFGKWKNMFRCFFNGLHMKLETTKAAIVAVAIIYNIYMTGQLQNGDSSDEESDEENEIEDGYFQENMQGNLFRQQYIQRFFN
ncbi:hypothetical protein NQ314_017507 [Rhamnusium bicolor]|uniref:Putative nuclease HARBI1 n=1 Tax=Rhamnusium bicolor TaxID=1586634 RepID=A0AAV8WSJ8_9CUCU|nr:hypothetical protein NQ314_017507 [Rhamnusium bicolor]